MNRPSFSMEKSNSYSVKHPKSYTYHKLTPYITPKLKKWDKPVKYIGRMPGHKLFQFQKDSLKENFKHNMKEKLEKVKEFQKWGKILKNLNEVEDSQISTMNILNKDFRAFDKHVAEAVEELKTRNLFTEGRELELKAELRNNTIMSTYNRHGVQDIEKAMLPVNHKSFSQGIKKKRKKVKMKEVKIPDQQSFNAFLNEKAFELVKCKI